MRKTTFEQHIRMKKLTNSAMKSKNCQNTLNHNLKLLMLLSVTESNINLRISCEPFQAWKFI